MSLDKLRAASGESRVAEPFELACPRCHGPLEPVVPGELRCAPEGIRYRRDGGIWRFLRLAPDSPESRFAAEYRKVRNEEGWGSEDPAYYLTLPFVGADDPHAEIWRIRATAFQVLRRRLPEGSRRLKILDLGAGNGWLSYRLSAAGHEVAAVDLSTDPRDGLGAHTAYGEDTHLLAVQASFDRLPFAGAQADLAIFNGSFHYSPCYEATLSETARVLAPGGRVVIMDSPFYRRSGAGRRMLEERRAERLARHGVAGDELPGEGFLSPRRLRQLSASLGLRWKKTPLPLGWRWHLGPYWARLRRRREPARFPLLVGRW